MKICPLCQRPYEDETLNFCLGDGAALFNSVEINESQKLPPYQIYSLDQIKAPKTLLLTFNADIETQIETITIPSLQPIAYAKRVALCFGRTRVYLITSLGKELKAKGLFFNGAILFDNTKVDSFRKTSYFLNGGLLIKPAVELLGDLPNFDGSNEQKTLVNPAGLISQINNKNQLVELINNHSVLLIYYPEGVSENYEREFVEYLNQIAFPCLQPILEESKVVLSYANNAERSEISQFLKSLGFDFYGCFLFVRGKLKTFQKVPWIAQLDACNYIQPSIYLLKDYFSI